jgi:glucose-6-phosphate 1-epimerase
MHETTDFNGLPALKLKASGGSSAMVTLHGAHIVSWKTNGGDERLYLSERSSFTPGTPIRGGIPLVFPQFSTFGELPRHGFARNMPWQLEKVHEHGEFSGATLFLTDTPETRQIWPFAFRAELTLSISANQLDVELAVENSGSEPFSFSAALHTYLRVEHVESTQVLGLHGCTYRDQTTGNGKRTEGKEAVNFENEVDRIYLSAPQEVMLREPNRSLNITATNFPDLVLWNPWVEKCAQIPDMPADGFKRMVCIEAALVEHPLKLNAGKHWWGRQSLVAIR